MTQDIYLLKGVSISRLSHERNKSCIYLHKLGIKGLLYYIIIIYRYSSVTQDDDSKAGIEILLYHDYMAQDTNFLKGASISWLSY